ncbi:MAG: HEPN domain-containing protein [Acetobacteraceae bacterium]|nr:HEPN domain-containing protein [Acetobacteraceae bacterium]
MTGDSDRALVSWSKANSHLTEAIAQDYDASPMAVIHSSYYAMFHAARAALFKTGGQAPKRHDVVIQQFGLLVRDFDDAIRLAGKAFNAVKDERTAADYDETVLPSPEDAREALQAAIAFLTICAGRFGFGTPMATRR